MTWSRRNGAQVIDTGIVMLTGALGGVTTDVAVTSKRPTEMAVIFPSLYRADRRGAVTRTLASGITAPDESYAVTVKSTDWPVCSVRLAGVATSLAMGGC
jgi:hypothetical protein